MPQDPSGIHPNLTVEVANLDAIYKPAMEQKLGIVYRLTQEPWGVRRFFVRDPNGLIVNVMRHKKESLESDEG